MEHRKEQIAIHILYFQQTETQNKTGKKQHFSQQTAMFEGEEPLLHILQGTDNTVYQCNLIQYHETFHMWLYLSHVITITMDITLVQQINPRILRQMHQTCQPHWRRHSERCRTGTRGGGVKYLQFVQGCGTLLHVLQSISHHTNFQLTCIMKQIAHDTLSHPRVTNTWFSCH